MTIHIQISPLEIEALAVKDQALAVKDRGLALAVKDRGLALRVVLEKAMKEAGIPYTWKLFEDNPRPSQPGRLTFHRDPINDLIHITWTPEG